MILTCNCCGELITTTMCCPIPPEAPWGTKCAEHEDEQR